MRLGNIWGNINFCLKLYVRNKMRVSKWWQNFNFNLSAKMKLWDISCDLIVFSSFLLQMCEPVDYILSPRFKTQRGERCVKISSIPDQHTNMSLHGKVSPERLSLIRVHTEWTTPQSGFRGVCGLRIWIHNIH